MVHRVDGRTATRRFDFMIRRMTRPVVLVVALALAAACDRPAPERSNDTTVDTPSLPVPEDSVVTTVESAWDSAAGAVFLTVGPNGATASVVFPDVSSEEEMTRTSLNPARFRGRVFDLMGNGQLAGSATLDAPVAADVPAECTAWPTVQLTGLSTDSLARPWLVAFERGRMQPIAFDSLAGFTARDSSRLAMELARVASGLPGDTIPDLHGVPYQVRRAYRFAVAPGVGGVIAEILRTLNQEASPRQEHVLLVAEHDSAAGGGKYFAAYVERTSGTEDQLESSELLTVARRSDNGQIVAMLARYVGDGVIYALLEREGTRRWALRWSSPYAGC